MKCGSLRHWVQGKVTGLGLGALPTFCSWELTPGSLWFKAGGAPKPSLATGDSVRRSCLCSWVSTFKIMLQFSLPCLHLSQSSWGSDVPLVLNSKTQVSVFDKKDSALIRVNYLRHKSR